MGKNERRADYGLIRQLRQAQADLAGHRAEAVAAMAGAGESEWIAGLMQQVGENVARDGWHATGTVTDDGRPYTYTAGLTATFGCPELVIAGLDPRTAHGVLGAAAGKLEGGASLEPGILYEGIAAGFCVRFRDVFRPSCGLSFAVTDRFYGRSAAFRQLVWPDPQGRFPDEPGCDTVMAAVQGLGGGAGPA